MKAGILTIHAAHNYGAILQAYATKQAICMLGHEAMVIDLFQPVVEAGNHKIKWNNSPGQVGKNIALLFHVAEWKRRYARFEQFKSSFLDLTERYRSASDLELNTPEFDAYVTGSDQVWNTENGLHPVWLLDFVKAGRKVAYAPSFGTGSVDPRYLDLFQKYLPQYHSLSCRESRGVEMIREMTELEAKHVLDPTFLLSAEQWGQVSKDPGIKEPYLLVYCLEESPEFMKLVPIVARRTGLPVVVISGSAINRIKCANHVVRDAGPSEFLGLFNNAAMVCTNSFHGTAFSINFRKDFVSVPHTTRNSRLESLLALTGLERRQVQHADELHAWGEGDFHIDYRPVESMFNPQIEASICYLRKALS